MRRCWSLIERLSRHSCVLRTVPDDDGRGGNKKIKLPRAKESFPVERRLSRTRQWRKSRDHEYRVSPRLQQQHTTALLPFRLLFASLCLSSPPSVSPAKRNHPLRRVLSGREFASHASAGSTGEMRKVPQTRRGSLSPRIKSYAAFRRDVIILRFIKRTSSQFAKSKRQWRNLRRLNCPRRKFPGT